MNKSEDARRNLKNVLSEKGEKIRGENFFAMIPLTLPGRGINGAAWDVYVWLDGMQGDKENCWPSIKYISEATNQSETTVKRAIANLESLGLLKVKRRRGRGNYYFVINGARRRGQEIELPRQTVQKKTRKNNLRPNASSKLTPPVGSKLTETKDISEPIITSLTKRVRSRSSEEDKTPQSPGRLVNKEKFISFVADFGKFSA
jgi:hypothetical protein